MQHARQPSRQPDGAQPARPRRLRAAGDQDAPTSASPARELQSALSSAYFAGVPDDATEPEPHVAVWPGWARLLVIAGGAALCWGAVIGVAKLLLDN